MRMRVAECCAIVVVAVIASCRFPDSPDPDCDDDLSLCPRSSKAATSVICDCRCEIGISDAAEHYDGRVAVCLPTELNPTTASDEQRVALRTLDARTFDQRVFGYCSQDVARFVRAAVKAQARVRIAACAVPVSCTCSTKGTRRDSPACRAPCPEVACEPKTCKAVIQKGSKLDMSACECSRASACGAVAPPEGEPVLCRDWLGSVRLVADEETAAADAGAAPN